MTSGQTQLNCSASSNATVLAPSSRYGSRHALKSRAPVWMMCLERVARHSSGPPSTATTSAPYALHSKQQAAAADLGKKTCARIPAAAVYADIAMAALGSAAKAKLRAPCSAATETAHAIWRASCSPVGLAASSLIQSWDTPSRAPILPACTSGVSPSPSELIVASLRAGSKGA